MILFLLCSLKNSLVEKYNDFVSLTKLVATRYDSKPKIYIVSCQMILQMYWLSFLQKINTSVKHIDHKRAEISYSINGHLYKIIVKNKKGPKYINKITDEKGVNVTIDILPYLGPNSDWHNYSFTPEFWGKKTLSFEINTGEIKTFVETEKIIL